MGALLMLPIQDDFDKVETFKNPPEFAHLIVSIFQRAKLAY